MDSKSYEYKQFSIVYSDSWYAYKDGNLIFKTESDREIENLINSIT